jgi:hypothetical protein
MFTTSGANYCKLIDVAELPLRLRRRPPGACRLALFAVLTFGSVSPARADAPSSEGAAEARRSEAKAKFEQGVNLYGEHKYRDAVNAFLQADAIAPSAALSFNIARAFEHLDDATAALRWYRDYLRRSPTAQNVADVQQRVTALAATLAERGLQQLSVLSTPSGAAVNIDNQPRGTTPLTIELAPGAHHVRLELAGYADKEADLTLDAHTPQDFSLELAPSAPVATPTGAASNRSDAARPSLRAKTAASRPCGPAPFIVLGAGGVSLLGALGFELARRSAESAAEDAPQREYLQHFDAMQSRKTTARVLAGVGGALLLTGGVLLVLNTPKEPTAELAFGCSGAYCSLWAGGSFQ